MSHLGSQEDALNKLWAVTKEEWTWDNLDPEKLYSISEHRLNVAEEVIRCEGQPLLKEPHGGARKKTNLSSTFTAPPPRSEHRNRAVLTQNKTVTVCLC